MNPYPTYQTGATVMTQPPSRIPSRGRSRKTAAASPNEGLTISQTEQEAGAEPSASAQPENEQILIAIEHSLVAMNLDDETVKRIEKLPRDVGWLLITAGVLGVALPGVLGFPFLVLGGLVVMPATSQRAESWLAGHGPKMFKGSVRQINRFLDDLEQRYPTRGRASQQ